MIYFLASTLGGLNGGSRAGSDILRSMLAPDMLIAVVCRDRVQMPKTINGQAVPQLRWIVPPPLPIHAHKQNASIKTLLKGVLKDVHDRSLRFLFERELIKNPPTLVVHNGFPVPDTVNANLLERAQKRLIIVHSSPEACDYFRRGNPALTRQWVSYHLRNANVIVFVSPQIREAWSIIAGIDEIPTYVISNTTREDEARKVKDKSRSELRKSLQLPDNAFIVSCIGKVDTAKGQDVLVKALPQMVKTEPNLHVLFVGVITPFGKQLPAEIESMGLSKHVTFTGQRDDAYSLIRAADMLIHPSRAEGQSLTVLEAMILKTPILASNVGGIPFSIEHEKSGLLVQPGDPEALAIGFRTLVQTPGLMEHLAENAEKRYWENFSQRVHREQIQTVVRTCLKQDNV